MKQGIRIDRRFAIIDEWVLDLNISDRAIRLYAVLARYADKDTHKAFPSRKTLAQRLRCSPASVDRASAELVEAGLLVKEYRYNNSIVYTVITSSPVQTPIITDDETLSSPVHRPIITGDDLTRTTKREPKEPEPHNEWFDQFWSIYPAKKDKPAAKRAFKNALKRTTLETILDGAQRYRDDPNREPGFTKNPSTWLNNDAWENGPEVARRKRTANEHNLELLRQIQAEQLAKSENEPKMIDTLDYGAILRRIDD